MARREQRPFTNYQYTHQVSIRSPLFWAEGITDFNPYDWSVVGYDDSDSSNVIYWLMLETYNATDTPKVQGTAFPWDSPTSRVEVQLPSVVAGIVMWLMNPGKGWGDTLDIVHASTATLMWLPPTATKWSGIDTKSLYRLKNKVGGPQLGNDASCHILKLTGGGYEEFGGTLFTSKAKVATYRHGIWARRETLRLRTILLADGTTATGAFASFGVRGFDYPGFVDTLRPNRDYVVEWTTPDRTKWHEPRGVRGSQGGYGDAYELSVIRDSNIENTAARLFGRRRDLAFI